MMNVIAIRGGSQTLALGLPERGMPVILGLFEGEDAEVSDGLPALAQPPLRHNGVDDAPPEAALLPTGAFGFFGWPALCGHRDGRDWTLLFAGWNAEQWPDTAVLRAVDEVASIEVALHVAGTVSGAWTMRAEVTNLARTPFALDRCMAGSMAVPRGANRLVVHDGGWGREFHAIEERLGVAPWLRESRRGRTSHDRSPTLFLREDDGPAWGFHWDWDCPVSMDTDDAFARGVPHAHDTPPLCAGVPATDGRSGPCRPRSAGARPRVRAVRSSDPELGGRR